MGYHMITEVFFSLQFCLLICESRYYKLSFSHYAYYLKETVHLFVKQNVDICSLKYYLHIYRNISVCVLTHSSPYLLM